MEITLVKGDSIKVILPDGSQARIVTDENSIAIYGIEAPSGGSGHISIYPESANKVHLKFDMRVFDKFVPPAVVKKK